MGIQDDWKKAHPPKDKPANPPPPSGGGGGGSGSTTQPTTPTVVVTTDQYGNSNYKGDTIDTAYYSRAKAALKDAGRPTDLTGSPNVSIAGGDLTKINIRDKVYSQREAMIQDIYRKLDQANRSSISSAVVAQQRQAEASGATGVSLWEQVYDRNPYGGKSLAEIKALQKLTYQPVLPDAIAQGVRAKNLSVGQQTQPYVAPQQAQPIQERSMISGIPPKFEQPTFFEVLGAKYREGKTKGEVGYIWSAALKTIQEPRFDVGLNVLAKTNNPTLSSAVGTFTEESLGLLSLPSGSATEFTQGFKGETGASRTIALAETGAVLTSFGLAGKAFPLINKAVVAIPGLALIRKIENPKESLSKGLIVSTLNIGSMYGLGLIGKAPKYAAKELARSWRQFTENIKSVQSSYPDFIASGKGYTVSRVYEKPSGKIIDLGETVNAKNQFVFRPKSETLSQSARPNFEVNLNPVSNPTITVYRAANVVPTQSILTEGKAYAFPNLELAKGWQAKMGYKNVYKIKTNDYTTDTRIYSRSSIIDGKRVIKSVPQTEYIVNSVISQNRIGSPFSDIFNVAGQMFASKVAAVYVGGKRVSPVSKVQQRKASLNQIRNQFFYNKGAGEFGTKVITPQGTRTLARQQKGLTRVTENYRGQPENINGRAGYTTLFKPGDTILYKDYKGRLNLFKQGEPVKSYREQGTFSRKNQVKAKELFNKNFGVSEKNSEIVGKKSQISVTNVIQKERQMALQKSFLDLSRRIPIKVKERKYKPYYTGIEGQGMLVSGLVSKAERLPSIAFPKSSSRESIVKLTGVLRPTQLNEINRIKESLRPKAVPKSEVFAGDVIFRGTSAPAKSGGYTVSRGQTTGPTLRLTDNDVFGGLTAKLGKSESALGGRRKPKRFGLPSNYIDAEYRIVEDIGRIDIAKRAATARKGINQPVQFRGVDIFKGIASRPSYRQGFGSRPGIGSRNGLVNIPIINTGTTGRQITGAIPIISSKQDQGSIQDISSAIRQDQSLGLGTDLAQAQIPVQEQIISQDIIQISSLDLQKPKPEPPIKPGEGFNDIFRPIEPIRPRPRPPTPNPRKPREQPPEDIIKPDPEEDEALKRLLKRKIIMKKKNKAFKVFIGSGRKEKQIGSGLTRGEALGFGSKAAMESLAATFRIEESGTTSREDVMFKPSSQVFRNYQIRKGERIYTSDKFIQRRNQRLSSQQERRLIKAARQQKNGNLKAVFESGLVRGGRWF